MTNFEKWKAHLTIRTAAGIFDNSSGQAVCEEYCPARDICQVTSIKRCNEVFEEWANLEVTE